MISLNHLLKEEMNDPALRDEWERTALARAVANQVIRYRARHGLSQRELARRLGVSQAVVGRLELGEHEPKIATLSKLARVLGLRFSIDIHPVNAADEDVGHETRTERIVADGVELVVNA